MGFLKKLFFRQTRKNNNLLDAHNRLKFSDTPSAIYAIGDIHGELELLKKLEELILDDAKDIPGEKWIITIGDLIDRGPNSAQVIDHVMASTPKGFKRYCILGNHELFMLQCWRGELEMRTWMGFGGRETLMSYYGADLPEDMASGRKKSDEFMKAIVPQSHIDFLMSLPLSISVPSFFFAHAGIRPGINLDDQNAMDLLMIRDDFIGKQIDCDKVIVHGHTIIEKAVLNGKTINIDLGAYVTKNLTAVRIQNDAVPIFLDTITAESQ